MVQYTLAQSPEIVLNVSGKDSAKAREKAMEQLMELMDEGKLPTELAEGFSAQQLIEVKELSADIASEEDAVTQAVQILSNLASLKLKVQESRAEALKVRAQVDILFSDRAVSEEEIASLKEGFKVLKSFAQINLRYQEARSKAEDARNVLDRALKSPDVSGEVVTPTTPVEEAKSESLSPRAELRPVPKKP
jgi:LPS O-antigen subunit length determinant protein (WzzB/FepE family)